MQFIDAHCHLSPDTDFLSAFARANSKGVVGCVVNSVHQYDWGKIAELAVSNTNIRGAIGIHPWIADAAPQNLKSEMSAMLDANPNLIVGEIGMDKTRDNFARQETIFILMLEIAIKYKRIVNLHCVHAWGRVLEIFNTYRNELPPIIAHGFDGTSNAIDFDANLYFSYSPNIANPKYKKVHKSVLRVPKSKILIESDSDDLTNVITAADGLCATRHDISAMDVFHNAQEVFFNGQIA
ncbi:MAG: TatD family hydrolase [Alphaproteobacteria bacterium]|nr:TatD family hydrolase [Alphaproteobacteria bacterium]